jgi:hypothetical protein
MRKKERGDANSKELLGHKLSNRLGMIDAEQGGFGTWFTTDTGKF